MSVIEETIRKNFRIEGIDVDSDDQEEKEKDSPVASEMVERNFGATMLGVGRSVLTVLCNFSKEREDKIAYPKKVSSEEWKKQWFRAIHPSLCEQEKKDLASLNGMKNDWNKAYGSLKNLSTGSNSGGGGEVIVESLQEQFNKVLELRPELITQTLITRKKRKIADNHPESPILKKELAKGTYKKSLLVEISKRNPDERKSLREEIDAHIIEYQKRTVEERKRREKEKLRTELLSVVNTGLEKFQEDGIEKVELRKMVTTEIDEFVLQNEKGNDLILEEAPKEDEILFFKTTKDLENFKSGRGEVELLDWWYDRSE